ncbi:MAG: aspartate aminotransferase family protein [Pseudomonadales bacterium]|nr:aspartate aminotransferase family protein [Pseudomonadales bacterium]
MNTSSLMNTYGDRPLTFVRGEGCWLFDSDGKKYLDALGGIAVCGLGHANPEIAETIATQAKTLLHTSNLYNIPLQQKLADELTRISGMDQVFFANSGAEANEAAIKLARLYGHKKGVESPSIVVMEHAFHGRTLATLTATGNRKVQAGFEPLVKGFIRAPYNDVQAISRIAENSANVVAILVEPVQGEGGVHIPSANYLNELRAICDTKGWLLMLDEVQTGNGRTGRYFTYQHNDILPDVVTTAKGLGNGFPIGACLARGKADDVFAPGNHGSTYGGNPLACSVALKVLEIIERDHLANRARILGEIIRQGFEQQLRDCQMVGDIRGLGLMIGIELQKPCAALVQQAADKGLLINVTSGNTIRLLPPLTFSDQQADLLIETLVPLIQQFQG